MAPSLFSRNRQNEVQSFVLNLINNHCSSMLTRESELRTESRVNLTMVVMVVPIEDGRPRVDRTLVTVSIEFSSTGVSLVLSEPRSFDEVILGFPRRNSMTFVRAKARHLSPMGAGFFQLGLKLQNILSADEYPELESLADRF